MSHFTFRNLFILFFTIHNFNLFSQNVFKANELIQPNNLVEKITGIQAKRPIILNVGVEKNIKYAIEIGILSSTSKQEKLKSALANIKKNNEIVIYYGCCKLETCPNIPIAFNYVKSLGYSNVKILNMPIGLEEDWISKKYPMNF